MKTWSFTFLVCLLASSCSFNASAGPAAASPVPTAKVEEQLQGLWDKLDQGTPPANKLPTSWSPAYSVLFPTEWPPTPNTLWIRYAYAQGMDVNLHDGVYVSAPWARVELRGNSTIASIVPLSTRLEPVTTQGVVPIDAETQAMLAKEAEVSASCSPPCPRRMIPQRLICAPSTRPG